MLLDATLHIAVSHKHILPHIVIAIPLHNQLAILEHPPRHVRVRTRLKLHMHNPIVNVPVQKVGAPLQSAASRQPSGQKRLGADCPAREYLKRKPRTRPKQMGKPVHVSAWRLLLLFVVHDGQSPVQAARERCARPRPLTPFQSGVVIPGRRIRGWSTALAYPKMHPVKAEPTGVYHLNHKSRPFQNPPSAKPCFAPFKSRRQSPHLYHKPSQRRKRAPGRNETRLTSERGLPNRKAMPINAKMGDPIPCGFARMSTCVEQMRANY